MQHQRSKEHVMLTTLEPVTNLKEKLGNVLDTIKNLYVTDSDKIKRTVKSVFSEKTKNYYNYIAQNLPLDSPLLPVLESYIHDPEFKSLLDTPSHEEILFVDPAFKEFILESLLTAMFQNTPELIPTAQRQVRDVRIHVQLPGQIFPLHIDRPRHFEYNHPPMGLSENHSHRRYILFFDDQQPGQMFQMDFAHLTWKSGDLYTWAHKDVMHGSANIGYWPRFMLRVDIPATVYERNI